MLFAQMKRSGAPNSGTLIRSSTPAEYRKCERSYDCVVVVDVGGVQEGDQAEGAAQQELVLQVELEELVAALGEAVLEDGPAGLEVADPHRPELEAADALLAAQEVAVEEEDLAVGVRRCWCRTGRSGRPRC